MLAMVALAGCASYRPEPLPASLATPATLAALEVDPARLPFDKLARHRFDATDGLDRLEVAMLAVSHNPQLREARAARGIAEAQAYAAGLLPDPQLAFSLDRPSETLPGSVSAFNLNGSFDFSALLLRPSRRDAANAELGRVDLELLWQEWLVVDQAELLFTRQIALDALRPILDAARQRSAAREAISRQALAQGNLSVDLASADLVALQASQRALAELERSSLQNRVSLNAWLGLGVTEVLALVSGPAEAPLDAAAVRDGMAARLRQRPDLLALAAGYDAQEARLRGAVLAQFPGFSLGLTRARDNTGVHSLGFTLGVSLPLLNANQGNIRIERASRARLREEYQNRYAAAAAEVETALSNLALLDQQWREAGPGLALLQDAARRADAALAAGNLSAADQLRLQGAWQDKQIELINLQEARREQELALEALLGPQLPLRAAVSGELR